jgi:hypothetical protein
MSSGEYVAENVIDADHRLAVLVPCYNKERAVAKVVVDFRAMLPAAAVYVYDNHSTGRTVRVARAAGPIVRGELKPVVCLALRAPGEERRRS